MPKELQGKISIRSVDHSFIYFDKHSHTYTNKIKSTPAGAKAIEIEFEGIGKVIIGNSPDYKSLYNQISVQVSASSQPGENLSQMNLMLSMLGLGPVLSVQKPEDDERLKIATLYRSFYPTSAMQFERTMEFYELPPKSLIQHISQTEPRMASIFTEYLETGKMKKVSIYPGKEVWAVPDLVEKMRAKGALGLMMGVDGFTIESIAKTLAAIFEDGLLSTLDRYQAGLFIEGSSSERDLKSGGADGAYARIITEQIAQVDINEVNFLFSGRVQVLVDLECITQGAFGYNRDKCGEKTGTTGEPSLDYEGRDNLFDLTGYLSLTDTKNEVMIKNRIDPKYMKGLVVQSEDDKTHLVKALQKLKIITKHEGVEYILGKPVKEFIHVAPKFSKEMWK